MTVKSKVISIIVVVALVLCVVGAYFLGRGLVPKNDNDSTDVVGTTEVDVTDSTVEATDVTTEIEVTTVESTTVEDVTTTEPEATTDPINYEAIIVDLGDQLVVAHNDLANANAAYEKLTSDYDALVEELKAAHATIVEKEDSYLNLKASIDSILSDMIAKNAEVESYKTRISALEAEIAHLENTINELTTPVETTTETPVVVPEVTTVEDDTPVVEEGV